MKTLIVSAVLAIAVSGPAFAQKQKQQNGGTLSCVQRCANYCNKNMPNAPQCPERCQLRQCNR